MYPPLVKTPGGQPDQPLVDPALRSQAASLFLRMVTRGRVNRLVGALKRQPPCLMDLHSNEDTKRVLSRHYAGVRSVPLEQIQGSEGRVEDFDKAFNPVHERARGRWLNIASLRLNGAGLPPVELVQMGDHYYVRDGHHRISVAKALGERFIDAEVIVWDTQTPNQRAQVSFTTPKAKTNLQSM